MRANRTIWVREIVALVGSGIFYWVAIYPAARRRIRAWTIVAREIPDPVIREHALRKLTKEGMNPEAAAFFAVLAPRRHRRALVRLMVDFQIAYDYLDAINEQPGACAVRNGLQLHRALLDAVSIQHRDTDYYQHHPQRDDGGYLRELVASCASSLRTLPSAAALEPVLAKAVERCGEAQSRNHAMAVEGSQQLIEWTRGLGAGADYLWWELAAAGISCLSIHALFAISACDVDLQEAERVDAAYFPSVCAISALLDSLIDRPDDALDSNHSFVAHYADAATAAGRFAAITGEARTLSRSLARHHRHGVILAGIASFYLSAPEAYREPARSVARSTLANLGLARVPIRAAMRWRRSAVA
jgi:tetraprenyl-beta-curcumene synthase